MLCPINKYVFFAIFKCKLMIILFIINADVTQSDFAF